MLNVIFPYFPYLYLQENYWNIPGWLQEHRAEWPLIQLQRKKTRPLLLNCIFYTICCARVRAFFELFRRFLLREKIDECRRELPTPWRDPAYLRVHIYVC
jgi:hypothetical protein